MKHLLPFVALGSLVLVLVLGCGGGDGGDDTPATPDAAVAAADALPGEDLDMQAPDFGCILDGSPVRQFFLRNLLGHLDEALAVAASPTGGEYPVGTVIQLVPQEAMVKRGAGWNPTTNDWEFFFLSVSGATTTIETRGVEDVENAFGGNCFACHSLAAPQWDLICEDDHGCEPLPISDAIIMNLQQGDSRCD